MPLICKEDAPIFQLPGAPGVVFTGLVSPKRGSTDVSAWRVRLEPGTPGAPHRVTCEEVFVAIAGEALVTMHGKELRLAAGGALVVPANVEFSLANASTEPFEAVVVLPVGGQAVVGERAPFTPPWAE